MPTPYTPCRLSGSLGLLEGQQRGMLEGEDRKTAHQGIGQRYPTAHAKQKKLLSVNY